MTGVPNISQRALELMRAGKFDAAEVILRRQIAKAPGDVNANNMMAHLLSRSGRTQQALYFAQAAAKGAPGKAPFWLNLSAIQLALGKSKDALESTAKACELDPGNFSCWMARGVALAEQNHYEGARHAIEKAIEISPGELMPRMNLARLLDDAGCTEQLHHHLQETVRRFPTELDVRRSAAFHALNTLAVSTDELFELHADLGRLAEAGQYLPPPWTVGPKDPQRPLRVGYLSPDLREHSVAYFFGPILEHRDRSGHFAACYFTSADADPVTRRLRDNSDLWRDAAGMTDEALCNMIRADRIDILVDLVGCSLGARLGIPVRRPAPVQVTYLGYPSSTGLRSMGWRFVDSNTDPPGAERWATEKLLRLDPCFLCYRPPEKYPERKARAEDGAIVFGSFNNLRKLSDPAAALWARIIKAVPNSRLLLKGVALASDAIREEFIRRFGAMGVDASRLELIARSPAGAHLGTYSRMDIGLDTFPYNGTTTTCEALLMGVPVVTLAGERHAARVGLTLLRNVGLEELIAKNEDEYVEISSRLAADPGRLAELHSKVRGKLLSSPLCDGPAFVRRFEGGLRETWRAYCGA